jgi:predicted nucleic acid-binding protein
VAALSTEDWQRVRELVTTYADLRLGGTDSSVIALAERRGTSRIATLNRRHFAVVRPRHTDAFELLP